MSQPNDDPLPTPSLDGLDSNQEPPSNPLGIPEEALQGLLSRFGPGISELLQAGSQRTKRNERVQNILAEIQAIGEEERQLQGLIDLCDYFNLSLEELLSGFPVDNFVPTLVELLHYEHNPDIMLLTTRAMTYMIEAIPKSARAVVREGAVPIFCARLLSIQYIDVAEQTLQIFGKLAKEHSKSILEEGGLMAILTYLDFFSISVQRSSVATAADLCRNVPIEHFELVANVLPQLSSLLLREDMQIVESAILCYLRLAKSFESSPECIAMLASESLVRNCLELLSGGSAVGIIERPGALMNILEIVCRANPQTTTTVLEQGLAPIIVNSLQGPEKATHTPTPNPRELLNVLRLASQMLPSLPRNRSPIEVDRETFVIPQGDEYPSSVTGAIHREIVEQNMPLFLSFSQTVYGQVKETFSNNTNLAVRTECLLLIAKIIHFIPPDRLVPLLQDMGTSTFVATLLASNRLSYVGTALRMTDALLDKIPEIIQYFRREGAVHEIHRLASPDFRNSAEKDSNLNHREIKNWIHTHAQQLEEKHFSDSVSRCTDLLSSAELQTLSLELEKLDSNDTETQVEGLRAFASMIQSQDISTFEFLRSGATEALCKYLMDHSDVNQLRARWETFASCMETNERAPLISLLHLLQSTLTQTEKFVVVSNDGNGYGSGIKYLTRPFRLRLCRAEGEEGLTDFSSNSIGIEPLASIRAIEDFLWEKIKPTADQAEHDNSEDSDEVVIEDEDLDVEEQEDEAMERLDEEAQSESQVENRNRNLEFYFEGTRLSASESILGVFQRGFLRSLNVEQAENLSTAAPARRMWDTEFTLTYKKLSADSASKDAVPQPQYLSSQVVFEEYAKQFPAVSDLEEAGITGSVYSILKLLKFLYGFCTLWKPQSESVKAARGSANVENKFLSNKVTQKLSQQLLDTLSVCGGAFPLWCQHVAHTFSFLVPFEIRRQYFSCTSLGLARALHTLQRNAPPAIDSEISRGFKIGRIQRQKVRIFRSRILASALRVFQLYSSTRAVVEVEFFGEAGTGLGPTLEFFTLVSHQLQRKDLNLWVHDGSYTIASDERPAELDQVERDSLRTSCQDLKGELQNVATRNGPFEYVTNSGGLFPAPMRANSSHSAVALRMFTLFGTVVGRAILDERMLDIHLAIPFFKWLLGSKLTIDDLGAIYPSITQTLKSFQQLDASYQSARASGVSVEEAKTTVLFNNSPLEALSLYFVLPTDQSWELKTGGADILVTLDNVGEYVQLVVDALLFSGIQQQMTAFRKGVETVIPLSSLEGFTADELEGLVCGWSSANPEYWTMQEILDAIVCDHQYTVHSMPVQYFAHALSTLSDEEKRKFVRFLTGSPKLPIGGFKSLQPKLTIVRKETDGSPDEYLPSVMTCVNYVKLPSYSSQEITVAQIRKAIEEGQGSFHLS